MSISTLSSHPMRLSSRLLLIAISFVLSFVYYAFADSPVRGQNSFPAPPADRTLIYVANASNTLDPLPVERGTTPLASDAVAQKDKTSYIEVPGLSAEKSVNDPLVRVYLFMRDQQNVHPPFLVHLTPKRGARRVTAVAQKGLKGFAIFSDEIVKPHYRVLSRHDGIMYLEITPREALAPGEYAVIGTDLNRISTFRILANSSR